jgi:STE24 endopeptidase
VSRSDSSLESGRKRFGLALALAGAAVDAQAAVWLLRPKSWIEPAPVAESAYFTEAELERARNFARGQRLIALGALALEGAVLVVLVARPPHRGVRLAEQASRGRPLAASALVGAALTVVMEVAQLPLRGISRQRSINVGLATQPWRGWAADTTKGLAINAAFAGSGAAFFTSLARRFPRRWWLVGTGAVPVIEILFVWLAPVVLAPIFNRFAELPHGQTREDVLALAEKAGVDVGSVFVVDASRRTSGTNAFVTGLRSTKRIVLYDTLLERFTPAQVQLVVAHELAHVKNRDVRRSMLWVVLVAPAGTYAVKELAGRLAHSANATPGSPAYLPPFALSLALVGLGGGVIANQLSRRIEARADAVALEITGEPLEFIAMERELALTNVADPDPPRALAWLAATHPSTMQRIGAAVAFARDRRPSPGAPPTGSCG